MSSKLIYPNLTMGFPYGWRENPTRSRYKLFVAAYTRTALLHLMTDLGFTGKRVRISNCFQLWNIYFASWYIYFKVWYIYIVTWNVWVTYNLQASKQTYTHKLCLLFVSETIHNLWTQPCFFSININQSKK